jgi:hypothetical protein
MWNYIFSTQQLVVILSIWIGFYLSKRFGSNIGFVSIFLAPIYFLYLYWLLQNVFGDSSNYSWWWKILFSLLLFAIQCILLLVSGVEKTILQSQKDSYAENLGEKLFTSLNNKQNLFSYSLYLRPFDTTNALHTQKIDGGGDMLSEYGQSSLDLEYLLTRISGSNQPLIGLGNPGEMNGIGRILTSDDHWKEMIKELVKHSQNIFIIPSDHEGTLWEIQLLKEMKMLDKCIWIMPENISRGGFYATLNSGVPPIYFESKSVNFSESWEKTAEKLKLYDIQLPAYNQEGMLFKLTPNGKVLISEPLNLRKHLNKIGRLKKIYMILKHESERELS